MQSTRTGLQTLATLSRALPRASPLACQRRHASFSLSSLRDLLPRRNKDPEPTTTETVNTAPAEQPKGLFDTVVEDEEVLLSRQDYLQHSTKQPTFVSTCFPIVVTVVIEPLPRCRTAQIFDRQLQDFETQTERPREVGRGTDGR